jgi:hypothetical protein
MGSAALLTRFETTARYGKSVQYLVACVGLYPKLSLRWAPDISFLLDGLVLDCPFLSLLSLFHTVFNLDYLIASSTL